MEAIKKKMQAMKVEKDNLMDRCDACEQVMHDSFIFFSYFFLFQSCRDAKMRREKTEEEVNELGNKSKTLEVRVQVKSNIYLLCAMFHTKIFSTSLHLNIEQL